MRFSKVWIAAALAGFSDAKVIEASDADLSTLLANGVPTILDIYASWCGHCKTFSPVFDELAALYEGEEASKKIQFIKIDGDINRKASKQHKIEYFPTIKFIEADGSSELVNARDLSSLQELIKEKTGVLPESAKKEEPAVGQSKMGKRPRGLYGDLKPSGEPVELNDSNFEDEVDGKHALVAFTTTWCGHCKNLKPTWEKAAELYAYDDEVVIGTVDCTEKEHAQQLMSTFEIRGFPTIIYFPADGSTPQPYKGGRSLENFVSFFQENGASYREADGSLGDQAGVIQPLALLAYDVVSGAADKLSDFEKAASEYTGETAELYVKYAQRASERGHQYVSDELKRLTSLLKRYVSQDKADHIKRRVNVLKAFESQVVDKVTQAAEAVRDEL